MCGVAVGPVPGSVFGPGPLPARAVARLVGSVAGADGAANGSTKTGAGAGFCWGGEAMLLNGSDGAGALAIVLNVYSRFGSIRPDDMHTLRD